jgi:flagellar M-ring protein FliF
VGNLLNNLRGLSTLRLAVLGGVAVAMMLAFGFVANQLTTPPFAPLFTGLEPEAAGSVIARLDQMGVPYTVQGDSVIMVPSDQVARTRMTLAGEGLPNGGPVGYEILEQDQGLGLTRFQEDVRYLRALEGELARSVGTLNGVGNARVHLVLPKREPFSRDTPIPTASVLIIMRGAASLDRDQVMAVQYLVSQAVPRMKPQSVSVIDQQGNLLAGAADTGPEATATKSADARADFEARMARSIEDLLEPHLGAGKVRVSVTADLDFDRITERQEIFDPEGQVVRSTQTSSETSASTGDGAGAAVGVANNVPEAGSPPPTNATGSSDSSQQKNETVNYEISSKTLETIRESGAVKKISVAVVVDGLMTPDANGTPVYAPRKPEELAELGRAIKAAIGFDETRGDKVEVVNLPFAGAAIVEQEIAEGGIMDFLARNAMTLVQWVVLAVIALIMMLFVLRPLIAGLFKASTSDESGLPPALTAREPMGDDAQAAFAAAGGALPMAGAHLPEPLRHIADLVGNQPDEAAGVIRHWIAEGNT